jgi:hypothetical protein
MAYIHTQDTFKAAIRRGVGTLRQEGPHDT